MVNATVDEIWEGAVVASSAARAEILDSFVHVVREHRRTQEELAAELDACRALLEANGIEPPASSAGLDDPRWTEQRRLRLMVLDRTWRFMEEIAPLFKELRAAGGFMS